MTKDWKYVKTNSANALYIILNKVNGRLEQILKNKYVMLVPANKNKNIIEKYEELWTKIKNQI